MTANSEPEYPHCGRGAGDADPVGCRGRLVVRSRPADGGIGFGLFDACLAHLDDSDRHAYLSSLGPGSTLDHRGTTIDAALLESLWQPLRSSPNEPVSVGTARFDGAVFEGAVRFRRVIFTGRATFNGARFRGQAKFDGATFEGDARFEGAQFVGDAEFDYAKFDSEAAFDEARFDGGAWFDEATFTSRASFSRARFEGRTMFGRAKFEDRTRFEEASFGDHAVFRNANFKGYVGAHGARFNGDSRFTEAQFSGGADFGEVSFQGVADFTGAAVDGHAWFGSAAFEREVVLSETVFTGYADFGGTTFKDQAWFGGAQFGGSTRFVGATFKERATFTGAAFGGDAGFEGATFEGNAAFRRALFEAAPQLGPLECRKAVDLSAAVFAVAVTIDIAAEHVSCSRTRWASTAVLRLRRAEVDLSDAVLEYPVSVATTTAPASSRDDEENTSRPSAVPEPPVRVLSLRGVDASHLVLADVDLSECRFAGTIRLDQLRLHGCCRLAVTPSRWFRRGLLPVRCTSRQTLAEEHDWRAAQGRAGAGWRTGPSDGAPVEPAALASVYRELRKGFEDAKNEPGAADFYYGEMEMRRHDRHSSGAERVLLWLYWAVSGYGLRASRALGWLLGAMAVTVLLMVLWGLPQADPKPESTGSVEGERITMTTDTPNPVNPQGPLLERLSGDRFEPAIRVVINSTVFRSSGTELTTFGTYTEMFSRLTEPVLLGLALLAVRNRVKR